ncbi:MAG: hypothetical protein KKD39_07150 [Candidatus Altiarchaeota archaeon]|nr:hypothetical protein [Candidatus Altiarchaeota archaeon]
MNVYRVFKALKSKETYWVRHRLLTKLQGKIRYSESDLNEILTYLGREAEVNKESEELTHKAIVSPGLSEKFRILKKLKGFDFRASACLLSFHNPRQYAEVNSTSWNRMVKYHGFDALEKDKNSEYNLEEYKNYLEFLTLLAHDFGMSLADTEYTFDKGDFDD